MSLGRTEVVAGVQDELTRFEQLVRGLDDEAWRTPTRCEGWTVADVAAHVSGLESDIAEGRFDLLAAPNASERQVAERRGRTPAEVADELQRSVKVGIDLAAGLDDAAWEGPAPEGVSRTLGAGVEAIWYDTYVHAQDIRAAIGLEAERGPGLRASVSHLCDLLTDTGWGPATVALDGLDEFTVSGGGGRRITGDPLTFVLVATGRADPALLGLDDAVNVYRAT